MSHRACFALGVDGSRHAIPTPPTPGRRLQRTSFVPSATGRRCGSLNGRGSKVRCGVQRTSFLRSRPASIGRTPTTPAKATVEAAVNIGSPEFKWQSQLEWGPYSSRLTSDRRHINHCRRPYPAQPQTSTHQRGPKPIPHTPTPATTALHSTTT